MIINPIYDDQPILPKGRASALRGNPNANMRPPVDDRPPPPPYTTIDWDRFPIAIEPGQTGSSFPEAVLSHDGEYYSIRPSGPAARSPQSPVQGRISEGVQQVFAALRLLICAVSIATGLFMGGISKLFIGFGESAMEEQGAPSIV